MLHITVVVINELCYMYNMVVINELCYEYNIKVEVLN